MWLITNLKGVNFVKNTGQKTKQSRFYCYKTNQRKSAWGTPEYMTDADWGYLQRVVDILKNGTGTDLWFWFWSVENQELTRNFFDKALGWPEGHCYCYDAHYCEVTGFPGLKGEHNLPKLEEALKKREANV